MPNFAFNHVHLRSKNLDEAVKFYEEHFDAKIEWRREWGDGAGGTVRLDVKGAGIMISTEAPGENPVPGSTNPRFGLDHFGFEVDDLDEVVGRMKAKGVEFLCEPWEMRPGIRIAFIKAPDDVSIELSWHGEEAAA